MLSRNISVQITKFPSFSKFWLCRETAFQTHGLSICLNILPHVWSLHAKLAFFEEFPLSDLISFSLFMLENPQGNTYLYYMYACVGVGIEQRAKNH